MPLNATLRRCRSAIRRLLYRGSAKHCPVCEGDFRRFRPAGVPKRPQAKCPGCGSRERDRLAWLFLATRTDLLDGEPKRMLHIAPEACLAARFRDTPALDYLTADLSDASAMVRMDITDIEYPDASFDVVYCSHVLEHVPDDGTAMRELHRVLDPDGWAFVMVPITAERTVEDPTVTDPEERLRRFGQRDHVRRYGPDVVDRLHDAGFRVSRHTAEDTAGTAAIARLGLMPGEIAFYCTRGP